MLESSPLQLTSIFVKVKNVTVGKIKREGCLKSISSDLVSPKFRMSCMAKNNCGSSRIIMVMPNPSVGLGRREAKPRQAPLASKHIILARNARI